eukprot:1152429-Pelagomonas_calceolata.AAC.1
MQIPGCLDEQERMEVQDGTPLRPTLSGCAGVSTVTTVTTICDAWDSLISGYLDVDIHVQFINYKVCPGLLSKAAVQMETPQKGMDTGCALLQNA